MHPHIMRITSVAIHMHVRYAMRVMRPLTWVTLGKFSSPIECLTSSCIFLVPPYQSCERGLHGISMINAAHAPCLTVTPLPQAVWTYSICLVPLSPGCENQQLSHMRTLHLDYPNFT
jgi:hypothetical protein